MLLLFQSILEQKGEEEFENELGSWAWWKCENCGYGTCRGGWRATLYKAKNVMSLMTATDLNFDNRWQWYGRLFAKLGKVLYVLNIKPLPLLMCSRFSLDSTVQFSCDEDYVLQGAKSITCQRIAEVFAAWSDHRPVCKGKKKKNLFVIYAFFLLIIMF